MQKIGLALGSGSVRGIAHIGVIKALNEANIPIHCVSGTSAGAIIGGVYTAGDLYRLEKELQKMTWQNTLRYFDLTISKNGLFNGQKIHKFIENFLHQKTFQGLKIKFCVVTTEIRTGKEVSITTGKIINAIRASMAIPGIFTPIKNKGVYLTDGGLVNPVPINLAYKMGADIVIGVDLNHPFLNAGKKTITKKNKYPKTFLEQIKFKYDGSNWRIKHMINKWIKSEQPSIFEILNSSISIMQNEITQKNLMIHPADILLQPKLGNIGLFDFHQTNWIIEQGYKEMKKQIPKLKKMINS